MFENENLVAEEVTENVEQTTEETVEEKKYTEAELNARVDEILGKKIARREAKIRKEYERKYGDLENVVTAGVGTSSVEEATEKLTKFYESKGIKINKPSYTNGEVEVLARAEAADIINAGFDEVVEEVDRLTRIGAKNMTDREKAVFKVLAEHRQGVERANDLAKIGVTEDIYNSAEFKDFAGKFNPTTPIKDIYDIYRKTKPQKEIRTMGSMKQSQDYKGAKEYYSPEEIERLTEEELDDPKVWEAVRRSMTGR